MKVMGSSALTSGLSHSTAQRSPAAYNMKWPGKILPSFLPGMALSQMYNVKVHSIIAPGMTVETFALDLPGYPSSVVSDNGKR
jgi:hypothetical protein